ncbi:MAG: hypothetical protein JSW52_08770 [Candidatus Coatesbacteria bacterium]|nr:MAG: hypothetical protein JSW52_08770 [Candidatus Coatesbacteria bacterium]
MKNITIVGLVFAVLLFFTACGDGGTTPIPGNTPLETLQAFRTAFNNGDTNALDGLLPSNFRFHFDADDVGTEVNGYTIPASWGRAVFLTAVGNMFGATETVTFSFDESDVGEPRKGDTTYETGNVEVTFKAMIDDYNWYEVIGPLTFYFTLDSADGTDLWSLENIKDFTSITMLEEGWSFGRILALFYASSDNDEGRTPAETLEALEESFNAYSIDLFKDVLAPDVTFHFDQNDVGDDVGGYVIPESWGYGDLTGAVGNMFDQAYSIEFSIVTNDVGEPDVGATEFTAKDVEIRLLVMVDATNGFLPQGFCDFRFVNVGSAGYDDWIITDWWDKTAYGGMEEPTTPASLGVVLAVYH